MIRLARPSLGEEERAAVAEVLESGMLVQGARVAAFEDAIARRAGRAHAIAVSTGTSALELALAALGIGPGDDVLVPDLTWPSPAHAVMLRGARPILVDVDARSWNATADAFAGARTDRTRAAIAIDQFGFPADLPAIAAALPGVAIVEDAACAIGANGAGGRAAGSFGAIACLSFHPRKVVTTGEGGMCITDDDALAARVRALRNHGQEAPGRFVAFAGNHRLTEMAAAIGLVQLSKLDRVLMRRRAIAERYARELDGASLQEPLAGSAPSVQTFGVLLSAASSRAAAIDAFHARGVEAGILSYALHRLPAIAPADDARFPIASAIADRGIALPLHAEMSDDEAGVVIETARSILAASP